MKLMPPVVRSNPPQRHWKDVKIATVAFALCMAAPVLPLALIGQSTLLAWRNDTGFLTRALGTLVEGVVIAELWWLIGGLTYFYVVARKRGIVHRVECLLLGGALGLCYPPLAILAWSSLSWFRDARNITSYVDWVSPAIAMLVSDERQIGHFVMTLGLGLCCGWVLWQFGVKPAHATLPDVRNIFD